MGRKRHKPKEIIAKLRQVDVLTARGTPVAEAIRSIGVTEATYYRWRQEYGGLKSDQVKRLKDLEIENRRLRKAVSDLTLDKLILQEAANGSAPGLRSTPSKPRTPPVPASSMSAVSFTCPRSTLTGCRRTRFAASSVALALTIREMEAACA